MGGGGVGGAAAKGLLISPHPIDESLQINLHMPYVMSLENEA